ncbi:hypothetical protein NMG60_11018966 [Bertholletia excelsa]
MRMSCNGCRVLRKGCSDDCSLRPCLEWILPPESQANATLFLAKFYGRAGLINLLNAAPQHLRPAIFKSLLYEACGRILNPIYGSVGLLWSGNWRSCQAAVDAVLIGSSIMQVHTEGADLAPHPIMPLKGCDIRHLGKGSGDLHGARIRTRFKRSAGRGHLQSQLDSVLRFTDEPACFSISGWVQAEQKNIAPSYDESMISAEGVKPTLANREEPSRAEDREVGLELSLGSTLYI